MAGCSESASQRGSIASKTSKEESSTTTEWCVLEINKKEAEAPAPRVKHTERSAKVLGIHLLHAFSAWR
jgi:hypothetical protein